MQEEQEVKDKVFWKDDFTGRASGGIFFRAYDLVQFIKKVEETKGKVIGINFEGNNIELIIEEK